MVDYDKKTRRKQRIDDFWDGLYDKLPKIAWIQLPIPIILFEVSMVIRCNYDGSGKGWFIASIISLIYVAFFFTGINTDESVEETGCLPLGASIGFISGFCIIFWLTEPGLEPKVTSDTQLGENEYELHDNRVFCYPCDSMHTFVCVSEKNKKIKRKDICVKCKQMYKHHYSRVYTEKEWQSKQEMNDILYWSSQTYVP